MNEEWRREVPRHSALQVHLPSGPRAIAAIGHAWEAYDVRPLPALRRLTIALLPLFLTVLGGCHATPPARDPLPSWNDGAAKSSIVAFVERTTRAGSPDFVPPEERIATFDQDGTLWVSHPMYAQLVFCLYRVPPVVAARPELRERPAFRTVLSGDRAGIARLSMAELEEILVATLTGMTTEAFAAEASAWLATARDPRWNRPFTELTYEPMQEVLRYLRAHGYKTFIVTGGGQDFVRTYSESVYGIPPRTGGRDPPARRPSATTRTARRRSRRSRSSSSTTTRPGNPREST
jgi:hypothetical protein